MYQERVSATYNPPSSLSVPAVRKGQVSMSVCGFRSQFNKRGVWFSYPTNIHEHRWQGGAEWQYWGQDWEYAGWLAGCGTGMVIMSYIRRGETEIHATMCVWPESLSVHVSLCCWCAANTVHGRHVATVGRGRLMGVIASWTLSLCGRSLDRPSRWILQQPVSCRVLASCTCWSRWCRGPVVRLVSNRTALSMPCGERFIMHLCFVTVVPWRVCPAVLGGRATLEQPFYCLPSAHAVVCPILEDDPNWDALGT